MEYKILNGINSPEDLKKLKENEILCLSDEIRDFLIKNVEKNGGHLASNLGVVELTLALHKNFDFSKDHLIFDVGHQCYTHKMITGRKEMFCSLRHPGGLSGFPKAVESPYDAFETGHSSTSLSAALGFAEADKLNGSSSYTVAVIGDGAYTGGMIHEALNNCKSDLKLIIILNENEMSISKNIGSFAAHLANMRATDAYYKTKGGVRNIVRSVPLIGDFMFEKIKHAKKGLKDKLYGSNYFENLGLYYLGPVDGNDYAKLSVLIKEAKAFGKSTVIHIKTKKGKGYAPAEDMPSRYHCIRPCGENPSKNTFSKVFGEYLTKLASENKDICAITASMADGTGLSCFEKAYGDRFFDVGIAEEHALTFCSGLASNGKIPVFCVYSSFLQRGYDNLIHDIALQRKHIVLGIDRCGINTSDGATHNGIFDVAFISNIPNTEIFSPMTYISLEKALDDAVKSDKLSVIRYSNSDEYAGFYDMFGDDKIHKGFIRTNISDISHIDGLIITYGKILSEALSAADKMIEYGKNIGIAVLEKLKPYNDIAEAFLSLFDKNIPVVFMEEGIRYGGAGEILLDLLKQKKAPVSEKYHILAIDDSFAELYDESSKYKQCGISADDAVKIFMENC